MFVNVRFHPSAKTNIINNRIFTKLRFSDKLRAGGILEIKFVNALKSKVFETERKSDEL